MAVRLANQNSNGVQDTRPDVAAARAEYELAESLVRCHNTRIAAVWVAFFSRQQRYCC